MIVGRFQTQGFAELFASGIALTGFQQGVGKIFMDVGALRRNDNGRLKEGNSGVVIARLQRVEGLRQRFISWIFRFLRQRDGGDQAKRGKSNGSLPR